MIRFLLICVLCFVTFGGLAQLSIGHEQLVQPLHKLKVVSMPSVDNDHLVNIELNNHQNDRPVHFAHPFSVDIKPSQSGEWEIVDKTAIWRVVIESQSAHSINLGFSEFYLPHGGQLYIYDYHNRHNTSPYTALDNDEHEQLWTPIVSSDKIVLEVNIPIAQKEELKLQLAYVNHDFLDIRKSSTKSCHIDVNCGAENGHPEIEEFRNQIRSVGLFTLSGVSVCSGFLVNNVRQDCTPYFMTAFHCNLNQENAPSLVTYWNYENSECRTAGSIESAQQGDGAFDTFNSGATWRAGWSESDFTLVEFDDEVPESANAYFVGWDINNNPPDRAVLIHHPNLEEKRISFADAILYTGLWGSETTPVANGDHLVLDHWDMGSTEGGSSGGPLFNRQGLVVGQLHGGLASCDNQAYDAFGRLFSSWIGGGTASTRLKDWLDPDEVGRVQMPGKNCVFDVALSDNNLNLCDTDGFFSIDVQVDDSFLGQVSVTFEGLPSGASAFFSNDMIFAGQVTTLTVANIQNLSPGAYRIEVVADNGQHVRRESLFFEISKQTPQQPILLSPTMDETVGLHELIFNWSVQADAMGYTFQLSENENLIPILVDSIVEESSLNLAFPLTANQNYYWRARAINTCGTSSWSPIFAFTAVDLTCTELTNTIPQLIDNEETSVVTSVIQNDLRGIVQHVEIKNIIGKHSFISDLIFSLVSPSGTEVTLMSRRCSSSEDFNLGFSDEGISEIICPPTNSLLYQPEMQLASFVGESAHGKWTLKVQDVNKFDGGELSGWTLEVCANPSIDFSISAEVDSLELCTGDSLHVPFRLGTGYESSLDIVFESNHDDFCSVSYIAGQGILIINPSESISPGRYPIEITVNDEFGHVSVLSIFVDILSLPSDFDLSMPLDESTQIDLSPVFSWESSSFVESYQFELARENTFTDLILSASIAQSEFTLLEMLETGEKYFWRVSATNRCGASLSQTNSFTTENTNSTIDEVFSAIEVYPNPTRDVLHVMLPANNISSDVDIVLSTLNGKEVAQKSFNANNSLISLTLTNIPASVYILSVQLGSDIHFARVVVQQ